MVLGANGGLDYIKVCPARSTFHLTYMEVADGAGVFRGHYDAFLPGESVAISVPQDGRCFWSALVVLQEGCSLELWVRPRMANGVAADLQRAEVEVAAA